jgi:hypothetical protein
MKLENLCCAAAVLAAASVAAPAQTRGRGFNINVSMDNVEHCADLRVRSDNGEIAQRNESVTLGAGQASGIELDDQAGRSMVRVRAWDRADYEVETCKVAVAETKSAAEQLLSGISVSRSAGRLTTAGPPSGSSGNWQLYFLIRAPRNANVDLQTTNGPVSVEGVGGNVKVRAINGPLSVANCPGRVDAQTTNGPISFHGNSGDVHLIAKNGPISVDLTGDTWAGAQLDAHTDNGPVSLTVPENYRSAVKLQSSRHAPLSCNIAACQNAMTDATSGERLIRINGSADTVRVSTNNGPVSIHGPRRRAI